MRSMAALVVTAALALASPAQEDEVECDQVESHTWWLVVGVLVLVVGIAIAFFTGYYVASSVTPSVRYTTVAETTTSSKASARETNARLSLFVNDRTAAVDAVQKQAEPIVFLSPPTHTNAMQRSAASIKPKSGLSTASKAADAFESPLDRFNFAHLKP